jgi:hypothetical protein
VLDGYGVADGRFGDPAKASGTVTQRGRLGPSQAIATGPAQAVTPTAPLLEYLQLSLGLPGPDTVAGFAKKGALRRCRFIRLRLGLEIRHPPLGHRTFRRPFPLSPRDHDR